MTVKIKLTPGQWHGLAAPLKIALKNLGATCRRNNQRLELVISDFTCSLEDIERVCALFYVSMPKLPGGKHA